MSLALFAASPSTAEEPATPDDIVQLRSRLARISATDDAEYADGAIEHARGAIGRAVEPDQEPAASARAREVARAALGLAERQLERHRTQEALFATQRRLTATRERAQAQRRVLEALMRERAALAREGGPP